MCNIKNNKKMETVKDTMVKSIKKTNKYGNKTYYDVCYEVWFNDGKLSEVSVCKNNAWNYTMTDKDKGLAITYNDDFAFYFKNLKMAFDMIERFENDLNLGRGKDMFSI